MEKHTTVVSFLLDETGSMQAIKDDTVGGFNAYVETLQKDGADIVFSLVSFNSHETRPRYVAEPIDTIEPLTADTYRPRAMTPLIDAAVTIINATDDAVTKRDDDPNVVIVVQTDGQLKTGRDVAIACLLGADELASLIEETGKVELTCEFCNRTFRYDAAAVETILDGATAGEIVH